MNPSKETRKALSKARKKRKWVAKFYEPGKGWTTGFFGSKEAALEAIRWRKESGYYTEFRLLDPSGNLVSLEDAS